MGELYMLEFPDGKAYIGATTKSGEVRLRAHRAQHRKSTKGIIYKAWRDMGAPTLRVLAIVENNDLPEAEDRAIRIFRTQHPNGYNEIPGGRVAPSLTVSVSQKIRTALAGRTMPDHVRAKLRIANIGKKHTTEALVRMRAAQKGKTFDADTRAKMAAAKTGRTIPLEVRERMSESQRKRRQAEGCKPQRWRYKGAK